MDCPPKKSSRCRELAVSGGSTVITGPCSLWNCNEKLLVNDKTAYPSLSEHFALSEK